VLASWPECMDCGCQSIVWFPRCNCSASLDFLRLNDKSCRCTVCARRAVAASSYLCLTPMSPPLSSICSTRRLRDLVRASSFASSVPWYDCVDFQRAPATPRDGPVILHRLPVLEPILALPLAYVHRTDDIPRAVAAVGRSSSSSRIKLLIGLTARVSESLMMGGSFSPTRGRRMTDMLEPSSD